MAPCRGEIFGSLHSPQELIASGGSAKRALVFDLEHGFDFDRHVTWQRGNANRTSRCDSTFLAEYFHEQFAAAVDHARLLGESGHAIHHAQDFGYLSDSIQRPERRFQGGQDREPGLASTWFRF